MIEVAPNLFVGNAGDESELGDRLNWFVVHAAKEPWHRKAVGYIGRGAPKDHPEYLVAHRAGSMALNLVDAQDVAYIPGSLIDLAIAAIDLHIGGPVPTAKVLVHCNQGMSRSPTIAMLYMASHGMLSNDLSFAQQQFRDIYPDYNPGLGMAEFVRQNWERYARAPVVTGG